ncbi:DKNYY domain-containing protein [Algoriphagus yeomjeoni]|uniref:DKNYY family protein n=1 Tax=Algoriphagus yeomjeoni TaxID=291403 RepID=A0A327PEP8_9BACT|nr:DKNYY domain-containing protein [Algoriphagus yeomjeoni]RAI88276.1 DKNYY family protein [Algoriphagus yeomjeoni]
MRQITKNALIICAITLFISCNSGYQKENGKWVWISYDEAVGKRVSQIDEHDFESFEILDNEYYAKDKNSVFHIRSKIENADPNSFELIGNGYSKDKNRVFLDDEMVIFANPKSFQLLEFPYSKDDSYVFCGTLPLNLEISEVKEFQVTNTGELMSGTKSSVLLSHFVEFNPEYKWVDTLKINGIIVGEWATGETKNKKFKGFKEIKE